MLSIGYAYDNRRLAEGYNSAGSPYWAMKAFLGLAAPADHPFWTADEEPQPPLAAPVGQPHAGFVLDRDDDHVVVLSGRRSPTLSFIEQATAKYGKFAYSSRFGFSGDVEFGWSDLGTDSTLLVSDGSETLTRWGIEDAFVEDGMVWSRWCPWDDVVVDTVLCGGTPWHHRIHLVRTGRPLTLTDTGFAVGVDSLWFGRGPGADQGPGQVLIRTPEVVSGIRGAGGDGRAGPLPPNANMMEPHAAMPLLSAEVGPGEHLLTRHVFASTDHGSTAWEDAPDPPPGAFDLLERERDRVVEAVVPDAEAEAFRRRRTGGDDR